MYLEVPVTWIRLCGSLDDTITKPGFQIQTRILNPDLTMTYRTPKSKTFENWFTNPANNQLSTVLPTAVQSTGTSL